MRLIREEEIVVEPSPNKMQFSSVGIDLRLDSLFREFAASRLPTLDVSEDIPEIDLYNLREMKVEPRPAGGLTVEPFVIHRDEFVIGQTLEYLSLPNYLAGFLDGRSSLARRGIMVHATAGSIEPGFNGHITLELGNIGKIPVKIYPLMRVTNLHLAYVGKTEGYRGQFLRQVRVKPPRPDVDLMRILGKPKS